jgi:hypothetical protein
MGAKKRGKKGENRHENESIKKKRASGNRRFMLESRQYLKGEKKRDDTD